MKKQILLGILLLTVFAVSSLAAGLDIRSKSTGASLMLLDNATGLLNVTTGKIAEQGVLLEDIYCQLNGDCSFTDSEVANLNVTTLLNATGATLVFDDDSIEEADINFATTCGSGNHLYISGGNLACEADADTDTDTQWDISTSNYLINNSNILDVDETKLNATIDARAALADTDTHVAGDGIYLTNDSTTMYFNETKLNATIAALDTDTDTKAGTVGPYLYNDSTDHYFNETLLNETIDARAAAFDTDTIWTIDDYTLVNNSNTLEINQTWTNATIDARISAQALTTDDFVNETGDTMTGDLVMDGSTGADVDLQNNANLTSTTGDVNIARGDSGMVVIWI